MRVILLGLACTLLSCGYAAASAPSLGEVEAFDAYRVYYAGPEVSGLPLEGVTKMGEKEVPRLGERSARWDFGYGDCTPPPREGGCGLPVSVQNWSTCLRNPAMYSYKLHFFKFRGTRAAWVPTAGGLEIYTGRTTVVIFGHTRSLIMTAARQLGAVGQPEAPSLLPPPAPGSMRGKLHCQRDWEEEGFPS
jgi:hypothetical protein